MVKENPQIYRIIPLWLNWNSPMSIWNNPGENTSCTELFSIRPVSLGTSVMSMFNNPGWVLTLQRSAIQSASTTLMKAALGLQLTNNYLLPKWWWMCLQCQPSPCLDGRPQDRLKEQQSVHISHLWCGKALAGIYLASQVSSMVTGTVLTPSVIYYDHPKGGRSTEVIRGKTI